MPAVDAWARFHTGNSPPCLEGIPTSPPRRMDLNESQRAAVEYGVREGRPAPPLLIIAGAGTGKTKTLAHRMAHLVLNGADPQRILLLAFTLGQPQK